MPITRIFFLLALALTTSLFAESPKLIEYGNYFAPHIIAGGEWQSEVVLTKHADVARSVAFYAWKQDGSPWVWDLPQFRNETRQVGPQNVQYYLTTLASKETRVIHFRREGDAEYGWAYFPSCWDVDQCGDVSGYVLLRNHNPLRAQDFETSYPFTDRQSKGFTMLFDQTNWAQMVLNLSNAADTVPWETDATFAVKIFNEAGAELYAKDVFLKKGGTTIINFAHESESLWGVRGRVEVRLRSGFTYMLLTGIRINDTGSFTPVQAMGFR